MSPMNAQHDVGMSLAKLLGDLPVSLASSAPNNAAEELPIPLKDAPILRHSRKTMRTIG